MCRRLLLDVSVSILVPLSRWSSTAGSAREPRWRRAHAAKLRVPRAKRTRSVAPAHSLNLVGPPSRPHGTPHGTPSWLSSLTKRYLDAARDECCTTGSFCEYQLRCSRPSLPAASANNESGVGAPDDGGCVALEQGVDASFARCRCRRHRDNLSCVPDSLSEMSTGYAAFCSSRNVMLHGGLPLGSLSLRCDCSETAGVWWDGGALASGVAVLGQSPSLHTASPLHQPHSKCWSARV